MKESERIIEEIAKTDYEFDAPRSYFDWNQASDNDRRWYLRKAAAIFRSLKKPDGTPAIVVLEKGDKVICKTAWDLLSPTIQKGLEVERQESGYKVKK